MNRIGVVLCDRFALGKRRDVGEWLKNAADMLKDTPSWFS